MSRGNRAKLVKGAAWIGSASLLVNALGLVSTILLARLLVPADFGLIAIALAVTGIINVVSEFSLSKALVQHDNPTAAHYNTAWTMNVLRGVIIATVIALLSWPIGTVYGDNRLSDILLVMAATTFVGGFVNPKLAMFERDLQFHQAFIQSLTAKVIGFVATISLAIIYRSYWALVLGTLITESFIVVVSYMLLPYRPKLTLSKHKELLSYSIWLTFGNGVQAIGWRIDPLVLGSLFTPQVLGQYSAGDQILSRTIGEMLAPVKRVLFPAFSQIKNDAARLRSAYLRSQGVLCLACFPVAVGFAVIAPELVIVALGSNWPLAIPVVQGVAMLRLLQATEHMGPLAMATGNTKLMFGRELRAFLIRWPFMLLGIYLGWGNTYTLLLGILFGRIADSSVNVLLNMALIARFTTITISDHLFVMWRPALAATAMAAAVLAIRPYLAFGTDFEGLVLRLAVMVPLGALIYVACLVAVWIVTGRRKGIETEALLLIIGLASKLLRKVSRRRTV